MMALTRRPDRPARAIHIGGRRARRFPRIRRTPGAALILSLLALLAPDLTLAPAEAGDGRGPSPAILEWLEEQPLPEAPSFLTDRRIAGGLPPESSASEAAPVDAEAFARALDAARANGKAYGVTFAIVRDGELAWAGGSGRARDGRTLIEADTGMVIGSVTKTFVAAAVLQLAEEGELNLDDPVRDHLPELDQVSREITVRQLLDHTSGLADLFNDDTRRGLEQDPGHAWTSAEVLATVRAPWYRPGEGWAYANTNYYLLGMIAERLTGATLADVLADRFFGPLDLEGTRILTGAAGDPLQPAWTSIFWASGAMAAPAADLARWGDALYTDGILDDASRASMLKVNDDDYGLGLQRIEIGDLEGVGHTGLLNTYTTLLLHLPEEEVTLALLVNRSHVDLGAMLQAEPRDGPSLLELALDD